MAGRWLGWAREIVRALRGLPDEEIRQKTAAMHEELVRLRRHRAIHEKEREVAALKNIRKIVEDLKTLDRELEKAEKATVEYVDTIAEEVTKQMEAKLNEEMDHVVSAALAGQNKDPPKFPNLGSNPAFESTALERSPSKSKQQ